MNDYWRDGYDAWKTRCPEDDAAAPGEPCPVCGDATTEGSGPCSDTCERILAEQADTERPEAMQ